MLVKLYYASSPMSTPPDFSRLRQINGLTAKLTQSVRLGKFQACLSPTWHISETRKRSHGSALASSVTTLADIAIP